MKQEEVNHLFAQFPDVSTSRWEARIRADLKGADYRKKLFVKTDEGMDIKPFYRAEDLESLHYLELAGQLKPRGNAPNGWIICQDIFPGSNLKETKARILSAVNGGSNAIRICLTDSQATVAGLISSILEEIPPGETEIHFRGSLSADSLYEQLCDLSSKSGMNRANLKGSLGADPLGKMVSTGLPIASLENLGKLVRKVKETSPEMYVIEISGSLIQNAGATLVEELAVALAMANEYLVLLTSQGTDPQQVTDSMILNLAAGPDYFMEIAKLRAARLLWSKIIEQYGISPANGRIRIHSTSSEWNTTLYDPYMNILRGTTEAMAAVLGGADLLSILPFDYPYSKGNMFSDRIARNVQIILKEEAYFDRVSDPASGSYYVESLTGSIGENAWNLFREIESKGGFRKAFESGWIQEMVLASRKKKTDRLTSGETRILGTNAYPDFNEMILDNLDLWRRDESEESPLIPLRPFRLASGFEKVRLETERSEKRPRVYLFKYGDLAWVTTRAMFSGNFFACAGYEIMDQPVFETVEDGIEAVRSADPDIIVLCSPDETYSDLAPRVLKAINKRTIIVVAGYPGESAEELRKSGINYFIHMKSNLLETLEEFNKILL